MKLVMLFLFFLFQFSIMAKEVVKVGAYNFPPFIEWRENTPLGHTVNIVAELNKIQNKYLFELVETTAQRRYEDYEQKRFDLIIFESKFWGWNNIDIQTSQVFMKGGEVFIALKKDRKQSYFNDLKSKSIKGISGYHYAFLNFSTSEDVLAKYRIEMTNTHEGNIKAVIEERVDIAIITKEYLDFFLEKNPEYKNKILISKKYDQIYNHTILLRPNIPLKIEEVNRLLKQIKLPNSKNTSFRM